MMRQWRSERIGIRLIRAVILATALILLTSLGTLYLGARARIEYKLQENARQLALAEARGIETILQGIASTVQMLAHAIESGRLADTDLAPLLGRALADDPALFALSAAFELPAPGFTAAHISPYAYRYEGQILFDVSVDNYWLNDWYRIPRARGQPFWTEPYHEEYARGAALIITLSRPFFEPGTDRPRVAGILAADIALDWLTREVANIKVLNSGFAVLLSRNGTILTHPDARLILNETLSGLAAASGIPARQTEARQILEGKPGFIRETALFGVQSDVYYTPVPPADWTLALVFPRDELFAEANRLTLIAVAIGLGGLTLLLLAVVLIARSIVQPLHALVVSTNRIAQGEFDVPLPRIQHDDEVGELTAAFAIMTGALRTHIRELEVTTAARERIASELRVARDIQLSILPDTPRLARAPAALALHTAIEPAREVGGDFYDFFRIDDERSCFLIADVSGKGVPAALFMALTRALIKASARVSDSPAGILTLVNGEIVPDNPRSMFVTVFCGIVETRTGAVVYANAGHNPPVLLRVGAAPVLVRGGSPQPLLGVLDGLVYRDDRLRLAPGDRLYLYTDGVTEAMDAADALYGEARLLESVYRTAHEPLAQAGGALLASIRDFAGDTPQSDDITLLLLEYRGGPEQTETPRHV